MDNLFDLTGRVAVVTGASSGLGADAARAYAGQGADVALLARRVEKLKTVADEIAATGRKVLVVGCDVTDEEQVRKAIGQVVARFGKIDILLNNAGVAVPGTVEQLTTDEWDKEMNTNVRGAYLVCKYVVPHMRERRYGKIVNISSVNALIADKSPLLARHVYNASKRGGFGIDDRNGRFVRRRWYYGECCLPRTFRERDDRRYAFQKRGVHEDVQFHRSDEPSRSPGRTERYDPLFFVRRFELCHRSARGRRWRCQHRLTEEQPTRGGLFYGGQIFAMTI